VAPLFSGTEQRHDAHCADAVVVHKKNMHGSSFSVFCLSVRPPRCAPG
jgi:hypothetical protein